MWLRRPLLRCLSVLLCFMSQPCLAQAVPAATSETFDALVAQARAAMMSDPHLTIEKAQAAERLADRQPVSARRSIMRATAMWLHGEALTRVNDVAGAKPLIAQAAQIATRFAPGSNLQGDALLASGWINTAQADVANALIDYQNAYRIFHQLGEVRSQSKALQQIGSLYSGGNDLVNALKYFDQALATYRSDPMLALSLYNNRGNALKDLGRYKQAEAQFHEALALTERMKSPLLRTLVLANVAEVRLLGRDVAGAQRAIDEGLRLSTRGEAIGFRKPLIALGAQAAYQRGDHRLAATLIGERFADEDFSRSTLIDRAAHRTAYTIYRAVGEHDLALRHLIVLKRLDDEATALARSTNAALMAARFDFANQELKIASLQRDEARRNVAYEQARVRTQRTIFLGVAVATGIVMALLGFGLITLRRSRDKVRAANDDLAVTNTALGKALAAKTEFLATTSHEIRTPLNGILGMTQVMLADRAIAGATRDRLTVVHGAGVAMRMLVDDILDVAKMETGNLVIEAAPFDLRALLLESTRLWEDQAQAKGLAFHRELGDCPRMIVGDAARMRQIVFNLMSNALKFTATGSVTLHADTSPDDRLRIVVADTGVGIPADTCEDIFESFRQADTSTTRQFGGTGLGLAICRNIARAMGGDVSVASVPGEGSRFTIVLPLVRATAAVADAAGPSTTIGLLIVDGNPITRSMLRTLMAPHAGGGIALAATLDDALDQLRAAPVERLLIDAQVLGAPGAAFAAARTLAVAAGGATVTLLWPADSDPECCGFETSHAFRHVVKPVTGMALVANLYPSCEPALVSRAA